MAPSNLRAFPVAAGIALALMMPQPAEAGRLDNLLTNKDLEGSPARSSKTDKGVEADASACREGARTCDSGHAWACVKGIDGLNVATWWEPVGRCAKSLPSATEQQAHTSKAAARSQPRPVDVQAISYSDLYRKASPAVVLVYGTDGSGVGSVGTGSIVTQDGLVLTNAHVVTNRTKVWNEVWVYLKPERVTGNQEKDLKHGYPGEIVAVHPEFDLALIQIAKPPEGLPTLPLSHLDGVEVGEPTVAIGHPVGGGRWSLTTGRISASWEDYKGIRGWDVFQTETQLNPGNSGGPLLDGTGAIVGVNTFIVRKDSHGEVLAGLNFAVKASVARAWMESIVDTLPRGGALRAELDARKPSVQVVAHQQPRTDGHTISAPLIRKSSSKTKGKRTIPTPPVRPKTRYVSGIKPGNTYGGEALDTLLKRADGAFGELDSEVQKLRSR